MKHSTYFWVFAGVVPSLVVACLSAYAANYFEPTQDTLFLYQVFVLMLTLAAMSMTIFSVYAVASFVRSSFKDTDFGRLPLSAWLNMIAATIIGIICSYAAHRLGIGIMWSCTIGLFAFLGYLLSPMSKKIVKALQYEEETRQAILPTKSDNPTSKDESQTTSVNGDTIVNSNMTSNVMVNVVVQTPQKTELPSEAKLDTPPHDKLTDTDEQVAECKSHSEESTHESNEKETTASDNTATSTDDNEVSDTTVSEADNDPTLNDIAEILPPEFSIYPIVVIFKELVAEQILDENYQPNTSTITKAQFAKLIDVLDICFGIQSKWKVCENFWGMKNMAQSLGQLQKQKDQDLDTVFYYALERASRDPKVGSILKFANWLRSYENRHKLNQGLR